MIVRLEADGAVVADADDCSAVHVQTTLDPDGLRAALLHTGTGSLADGGGMRAPAPRAPPPPATSFSTSPCCARGPR